MKLILWNQDMTSSFNLIDNTRGIYATNLQGFGNAFSITKEKGTLRDKVTNVVQSFSNITMDIVFKTYTVYNELVNFIALNGNNEMIIQREERYYDVYPQTLPKGERNIYKVLEESFSFSRLSYSYLLTKQNFTFDPNTVDAVTIPLNVPHKLYGQTFINEVTVENTFYERLPIYFEATGEQGQLLIMRMEDSSGNIVQEVDMVVSLDVGDSIIVDSEERRIIFNDENGYDTVSRLKNSFLFLPNGKYLVGSNLQRIDSGVIKIEIKQYVLD